MSRNSEMGYLGFASIAIIERCQSLRGFEMIQELTYLQDSVRNLDITINKLANLTKQVKATREKLKAQCDELCNPEKPSASQIINKMRAELVSKGIDPDGTYWDYAAGNFELV